MSNHLVFVDTEFTHLGPLTGDTIEVAWAVENGPVHALNFPHTLADSDPKALEVNRYHEREFSDFEIPWPVSGPVPGYMARVSDPAGWQQLLADLDGATIVAENYAIDWIKLYQKIRHEPWHYRKGELSSLAWLLFDLDRPESMRKTADRLRDLGHDIPVPDHSASRDVECLRACFYALKAERKRLYTEGSWL